MTNLFNSLQRLIESVVANDHDWWDKLSAEERKGYLTDHPHSKFNHMANFNKIGNALGSNPGGVYKDKQGKKHYIKLSKSNHHALNEILATRLYQKAGAPVIDSHLLDRGNGKLGTISAWQNHNAAFNPYDKNDVHEAQQHFATHAWLSNWDAIGLADDNQVRLDKDNKLHTVDTGGALEFRAQGGPKSSHFDDNVAELTSMRDRNMAPNAARVFKSMTPEQLKKSAANVAKVSDSDIKDLVHKYSLNPKHAAELTRKLIARKKNLLKKLGYTK